MKRLDFLRYVQWGPAIWGLALLAFAALTFFTIWQTSTSISYVDDHGYVVVRKEYKPIKHGDFCKWDSISHEGQEFCPHYKRISSFGMPLMTAIGVCNGEQVPGYVRKEGFDGMTSAVCGINYFDTLRCRACDETVNLKKKRS